MSKWTEEVKQALEAATPGAWRTEARTDLNPDGTYKEIRSGRGFFDDDTNKGFCITTFLSDADAYLIANAPTWLTQLLQRDALMVEAFKYILEYWNRDENEKAMSNALWKIIDISEEALKQVGELE